MPSATRTPRVPLIGAALGVLALLLLVLLAVVLPRLAGAESEPGGEQPGGADAVRVELPSTVDGFVRVDDDEQAAGEDLQERLASAEDRLAETYGVPASIALYSGEDPAAQVSGVVTALQVPGGLFLPTGPAPDPALLGLARNQTDLVRTGDAICNVVYAQPVPQGQPVDDEAAPASLQCQLTSDDVTYQVDGSGMTAEQAVDLLDAVAASTAGSAQDQ